jgi:hypothetical protein
MCENLTSFDFLSVLLTGLITIDERKKKPKSDEKILLLGEI